MRKLARAAFYAEAFRPLREYFGQRLLKLEFVTVASGDDADRPVWEARVEWRDAFMKGQTWALAVRLKDVEPSEDTAASYARQVADAAMAFDRGQQGINVREVPR